ncbi:MAG: flagellar basal body-associated FliL family protein [Pseudomonadota bacterium]
MITQKFIDARRLLNLLIIMLLSSSAQASVDDSPDALTYFPIHPDIVTNFVKEKSSRFGFLNIQVQLSFKNKYLTLIELHQPIIEDVLVMHFSSLTEAEIKSIEGREQIRLDVLKMLQDTLKEETQESILEDILFTKYMWQ